MLRCSNALIHFYLQFSSHWERGLETFCLSNIRARAQIANCLLFNKLYVKCVPVSGHVFSIDLLSSWIWWQVFWLTFQMFAQLQISGCEASQLQIVGWWSWGVSNILNINHSPVWPEISSSHHYRGDIWWPGINSSQPRYSGSLVGDNKPSNYLSVCPNLPGGTCQFLLILHSSPSLHPARPNSAWNSNDPVSYNDHLGLAIVLQTVPHNTRNLNKLKDANYKQRNFEF